MTGQHATTAKGALRLLLFAMLVAVVALHFKTNFLGLAPAKLFDGWQLNGQARLVGGIYADRHGIAKDGAHMGKLSRQAQPVWTGDATVGETYAIFASNPPAEGIAYEAYRAQYGLHQSAYSVLSNRFGLHGLEALQAVAATLTALVLVLLAAAYRRMYGLAFAALFLACLTLPPFPLTMGRNLYWSPFLLYLPALAAAWLYHARDTPRQALLLGAVWLAMLLKCLSNYEYITTVTLLACSPFLVAPLFADPVAGRPRWGMAAAVFAACVAAFGVALLVHASVRGDGIADGLRHIYIEDIGRRTFGDASLYAGEAAESQRASVLDVLRIYFLDYPSRSQMLVPGKLFLAMIVAALAGIGWKFAIRHPQARRDAMMFVVFLAVPVSWFVFAKGHSYTQTHINFVLWFIGFMPALIWLATCASPLLDLGKMPRSGLHSRA